MRAVVLTASLAAASCAPKVQKPVTGPVAFAGPHFTDDGFVSFDGARLGLTIWPAKGEPQAVLLGLHGMNDYSRAFHMLAPFLAERGVTVLAIDQRGFGKSPHTGIWAGEDLLVNDAAAFEQAARAAYPGKPVAMMGISMGGAVAIRAAAEGRIHPDRLILAAPAVWGWSNMPPVYRMALWLGAHTRPNQNVLPPKNLKIVASDNNKMLYENWKDPLFLKKTRIDSIYGLVRLMEDAYRSVDKLPPNTLYLYGAHDQIIPPKAAFRAVRNLPETTRTIYYPQGYHMLTRDLHGGVVWADILSFIQDPAMRPPSGLGPIPGSKQSRQWAQGAKPQGNP